MRIVVVACAIALCAGVARADSREPRNDVASSAAPGSAASIGEIVVEGNTKTQKATVLLIARVAEGDAWNVDMVDAIRQRLVTSGLFSEVEVFWEPLDHGDVRLHILARDKHSWIVAPTFYDQPTNKGGGLGFGENNLFGRNQKLLLYGQIATGDSFFIGAWVVPNIGGSPLYSQLDTYLRDARFIEYAAPQTYITDPIAVRESRMYYVSLGLKLGVDFHGIKLDDRLRAANVSFHELHVCRDATVDGSDPSCVHGDPARTSDLGPNVANGGHIPKPGAEGWDVANELTFTFDRRANWYGIATGTRVIASFETALPALGSQFHYLDFGASYYHGWRFLERHNLVVKTQLHVGQHMPFQQEFLMGGTTMRGWLNNQFRGDFQSITNVEYSVPVFSIPIPWELVGELSMRALAFFDTGYTTFLSTDNPERNYLPNAQWNGNNFFAPFKNSIGVGTRFYVRGLVLPLLGVDFGYGLEARDLQIYLAVGLTD